MPKNRYKLKFGFANILDLTNLKIKEPARPLDFNDPRSVKKDINLEEIRRNFDKNHFINTL